MSKRNIIRKDDRVKIVNPEIVIRCGYPLSKKMVIDTIVTPEQKETARALLRAFGVPPPMPLLADPFDPLGIALQDTTVYDKVMDIMAYEILKQRHFGGKERRLFTERKESLKDATGYVIEKKVVQSGTYTAGGREYYGADYDYTPPYLSVDKVHVLCRVYVNWQEGVCQLINADGGIWIEMKNLAKNTT